MKPKSIAEQVLDSVPDIYESYDTGIQYYDCSVEGVMYKAVAIDNSGIVMCYSDETTLAKQYYINVTLIPIVE